MNVPVTSCFPFLELLFLSMTAYDMEYHSNSQNTAVINTGLVTDPKQSTVRAAVRRISSLPARPSTAIYSLKRSEGDLTFFCSLCLWHHVYIILAIYWYCHALLFCWIAIRGHKASGGHHYFPSLFSLVITWLLKNCPLFLCFLTF